jgi:class 3 adenylate cyclase/pimeloyl-ACP methyl ester carboxylesterase
MGERKHVTVMFADIKDSMRIIASDDAEDARQVLDAVVGAMMAAVHRYEGTVNKVLGDGIMALFGAPLAHEDHAVRAAYAALAVRDAVPVVVKELHADHKAIQVRVGLHSGEVVVRSIGNDLSLDYDAIGPTVHLASRMEQFAEPGTIRLTGATQRLAEGLIEAQPLGRLPVKGLAEPVETFVLNAASAARTRLQAAAGRGLSHFVGRQAELVALEKALVLAGDGNGQIVAVVGRPGAGKSRLFHEFLHSPAVRHCRIIESLSVSYGKATAWLPVINLLRTYFGLRDSDSAPAIQAKVTAKLTTLQEALPPPLPALLSLLDVPFEDGNWQALDPPQRRRRIINAVKTLLLSEAAKQTTILVFEDLHWIDSETQAVLDSLVDSLPGTRVLLLVNYRPEYNHGWGGHTYYSQLRTNPLPPASTAELLDALLGQNPRLHPLRRRLAENADGNPFYLEESVRALVEQGALAGAPGAYQLAGAWEAVELPPSVRAIIAGRIDRLTPSDKQLLQTAAVIGHDVPLTALQAITEAGEESLHRGIHDLMEAEFLYERRLFPDLEYSFKHAITQMVAYESLLKQRRRELHARVGETLERLYPDRLAEMAEALAGHYAEGEVWGRAAKHALRAGEKYKIKYSYAKAILLARQAINSAERANGASEEREQALELLGDLLSLTSDLEEANRCYERACELAAAPADHERVANKRHRPATAVRDGGKLAYFIHGRGIETLIFVGSLGYNPASFQPVLERICQDFRIITMQPRGFGTSDPKPQTYTFLERVADIRAVIEAVHDGPTIAVGLSQGVRYVVRIAAEHPALLQKLVLLGGSPRPSVGPQTRFDSEGDSLAWQAKWNRAAAEDDLESAVRLFAAIMFTESGTEDLVENWVQACLRIPPTALRPFFFESMPGSDVTSLLPRIRVPTLIMHGMDDRITSVDAGHELQRTIQGAQFYGFAGKGHMPIFTATQEFCDVLKSFVRYGMVPVHTC